MVVFPILTVVIVLWQPTTPLEPCEWLNKLLFVVWPNFIEPKLTEKFVKNMQVSYSVAIIVHKFIYDGMMMLIDIDINMPGPLDCVLPSNH